MFEVRIVVNEKMKSPTCCLSVSSENKRDRRTIEEVMAESRARKKQKTEGATDDATQDNDADDGSGTLSLWRSWHSIIGFNVQVLILM